MSKSRPRLSLSSAVMIIKKLTLLPTYLPYVVALKEADKKARDWNSRLEDLRDGDVGCSGLERQHFGKRQ
jgi:hypothetical protein